MNTSGERQSAAEGFSESLPQTNTFWQLSPFSSDAPMTISCNTNIWLPFSSFLMAYKLCMAGHSGPCHRQLMVAQVEPYPF